MHLTSPSDAGIFFFLKLVYCEPTSPAKLENPGLAGCFEELESPQNSFIGFEPDFSTVQLDFVKYGINKETHNSI